MEELYEQYRALLFTLAYQLTGSAEDAEDAVQDVFFKSFDVHPERLENPKAYLCKMVTNRCLNMQKSARKKREMYVGSWLPEPIRTPEADTLEITVVRRDLLSYAMLVLLERLTATERTVFVQQRIPTAGLRPLVAREISRKRIQIDTSIPLR